MSGSPRCRANDGPSVDVVGYDESWPHAFETARARLAEILGSACLRIHHVGSTSVPGLAAKPIIDILIETPDLSLIDEASPLLERMGYQARGEYGIPGRRYFSRPAGPGPKVHTHVFEAGTPRAMSHLRFRDFLRTHAAEAAAYGALKRRLAQRHRKDRDAYQAGKADFIEELVRQSKCG